MALLRSLVGELLAVCVRLQRGKTTVLLVMQGHVHSPSSR